MSTINAYAGASLSFYAPLIERDTGQPVALADVVSVEAAVGDIILSSAEFSAEAAVVDGRNAAICTLTPAQTRPLREFMEVAIRVKLADGRVEVISEGHINFKPNALTDIV